MSEYTAYSIVHIDDIEAFRSQLSNRKITSVVIVSFDHPCRKDVANLGPCWQELHYSKKWAIVFSKTDLEDVTPTGPIAHVVIDEDSDRWFFGLSNASRGLELLFSDRPWGDRCDPDPARDLERIRRARNIGDEDLAFMEECFQIPRSIFGQHLRTGKVSEFFESVGLPLVWLLDEHISRFPVEDGEGRCMLWDEYERLVD